MINAKTALRFKDVIPQAADVVIIGGGVIGVFASLYLRRMGKTVVLCEKGVRSCIFLSFIFLFFFYCHSLTILLYIIPKT